jgi:hypothetical protein
MRRQVGQRDDDGRVGMAVHRLDDLVADVVVGQLVGAEVPLLGKAVEVLVVDRERQGDGACHVGSSE